MRDYQRFSAIEFAQDDDFLRWVKQPHRYPEIDHFWENWLSSHPEKAEEVAEAKGMILAVISEAEFSVSKEKEDEIWVRLTNSINGYQRPYVRDIRPIVIYRIAASLIFLIGFLVIAWKSWQGIESGKASQLIVSDESKFLKEINNGVSPKTILLSDGSTIVLQPKSSLQYPESFATNIREIKLTGEAFFDVAKDPAKPFVVYSEKIVTKVTGTSFTIRAFHDEDQVMVQVRTGKVSVFTDADIQVNKQKSNKQLEGVILTPNQQVIFSKAASRMVKSLIENPVLLNEQMDKYFAFVNTPLREVFSAIEKGYGVEIIYDEELMGSCQLNASLGDMPLYDKIRLICKGVNAKYEIIDTRIVVTGKGCK